ncbi:MAG: hypothetical protein WD648_09735 [Planctomycetaceae bacterium]
MPRTARASQGGYCYHDINRGNARAKVFRKQGDFASFVRNDKADIRLYRSGAAVRPNPMVPLAALCGGWKSVANSWITDNRRHSTAAHG